MYTDYDLNRFAERAKKGAEQSPFVSAEIYHDSDPDFCGCDLMILSEDKAGVEIYREFCRKMAAHYKKLIDERNRTNTTAAV